MATCSKSQIIEVGFIPGDYLPLVNIRNEFTKFREICIHLYTIF